MLTMPDETPSGRKPCFPPDVLVYHALHLDSPGLRAVIADHLTRCQACRIAVEALRRAIPATEGPPMEGRSCPTN
jgi:hypothetical protein